MIKEIEYRFSEYTNLIEISDTSIFDKSISFVNYESVFMSKNTRTNESVILAIEKTWVGIRYRYYLYYLSSVENEGEQMEHEWYCAGELED